MSHEFLYFLSVLAGRTIVVATCLVIGLRLLGKRQIGQVNIYDLALVMALANAVQNAMTSGNGNLSAGIVCAGTLMILGRIATLVFVRWPSLEQQFVGMPTIVISDGQMNHANMRREGILEVELLAALREHGLCDPSDAALAVLDVDGSLSIIPKESSTDNTGNKTSESEAKRRGQRKK